MDRGAFNKIDYTPIVIEEAIIVSHNEKGRGGLIQGEEDSSQKVLITKLTTERECVFIEGLFR